MPRQERIQEDHHTVAFDGRQRPLLQDVRQRPPLSAPAAVANEPASVYQANTVVRA